MQLPAGLKELSKNKVPGTKFVLYHTRMTPANTIVPISAITDLEAVKKLLRVQNPEYTRWARVGNRFAVEPEKYIYSYMISGGHSKETTITIPRNFPNVYPQYFSSRSYERLSYHTNAQLPNAQFLGVFRTYQQDFVNTVDLNFHDLLLIAPTGHGKTVLATWLIVQRKQRTLVLVPNLSPLAYQWETAVQTFTNLTVEIADSTTFTRDITKYTLPDVLVMTFDLFYSRKEEILQHRLFKKHFNHVIMDESHKIGAATYQPVLNVFDVEYRLALTATFRRGDDMLKILEYHFLGTFKMENQFDNAFVVPVKFYYEVGYIFPLDKILGGAKMRPQNTALLLSALTKMNVKHKIFYAEILQLDLMDAMHKAEKQVDKATKKEVYLDWGFDSNSMIIIRKIFKAIEKFTNFYAMALVHTFLSSLLPRRRLFLKLLIAAIEGGRKPIFISKRKAALVWFDAVMKSLGYKTCLIIGATTKDAAMLHYANTEAQVLFGIEQLTKEGLDVPSIDTLFLDNAMSDIEQPVGRIIRIAHGKKRTMVIYPYDDYHPYKSLYYKASKVTTNADFSSPVEVEEATIFLTQ